MATSKEYLAFILEQLSGLEDIIYRSMMADFHGWLMMYVAPKVYGEMFVLGLIVYFVVAFFQMARIRKIPMDEALKNVE